MQDATLRDLGCYGGYAAPHRAFRKLSLSKGEICGGFALLIAATAAWVLLLPDVARFWVRLLSFWIEQLRWNSSVLLVDRTVLRYWPIAVPYFSVNPGPTTGWTWFAVAAGTALLFLVSFKIPKDTCLPFVYLTRALCLIQSTALIYTFGGRSFAHDPAQYCADMLLFGIVFIGLLPLLLALTFYIFDVSFAKKIALTVLAMAHLALFIPLQYLLHACILHVSTLFLPVLYFAFGPFLDVIAFIGFYSWGMSWSAPRCSPGSSLPWS
jgi:hypothetical protein